MDEWFKPTWIAQYLEAFGSLYDGITIPTRQLWHNIAFPEQNFGMVAFIENGILPFIGYQTDNPGGPVKRIEATNDNSFLYLNIEVGHRTTAG